MDYLTVDKWDHPTLKVRVRSDFFTSQKQMISKETVDKWDQGKKSDKWLPSLVFLFYKSKTNDSKES